MTHFVLTSFLMRNKKLVLFASLDIQKNFFFKTIASIISVLNAFISIRNAVVINHSS
jgi:hypothetical protein